VFFHFGGYFFYRVKNSKIDFMPIKEVSVFLNKTLHTVFITLK